MLKFLANAQYQALCRDKDVEHEASPHLYHPLCSIQWSSCIDDRRSNQIIPKYPQSITLSLLGFTNNMSKILSFESDIEKTTFQILLSLNSSCNPDVQDNKCHGFEFRAMISMNHAPPPSNTISWSRAGFVGFVAVDEGDEIPFAVLFWWFVGLYTMTMN